MGNGEWQCDYGAWHDAGEPCDCGQEEGPAADQSTQGLIKKSISAL